LFKVYYAFDASSSVSKQAKANGALLVSSILTKTELIYPNSANLVLIC